MPRIESTQVLPVSVDEVFALSQSQGAVRYAWDPFVRDQRLRHFAEGCADPELVARAVEALQPGLPPGE